MRGCSNNRATAASILRAEHLQNCHVQLQVQCCFTSTETVIFKGLLKDGEPMTATSTLTQLLSSEHYYHHCRPYNSICDWVRRNECRTFTENIKLGYVLDLNLERSKMQM